MVSIPETVDDCGPNDGGILFKLSPEVRDEIYRYLVKGRFVIVVSPWTFAARFNATSDPIFDVDGADFAILRASKTFSPEAIEMLYTESTFEFWLDFDEFGPYTQHAKGVTDRMMKLKYHIVGLGGAFQTQWDSEGLSRSYLENMKDICESTIDHFTGTEITRHSMQIILHSTTELDNAFTSPLFQSLKRLGGFRGVRVEFRSSLPVLERNEPQIASDHMNEVMRAARAHLEPALGPATPGYFSSPGVFDFYGYLTFRPNQYLVKRIEAGGKEEE
ncbi:MAG: hypothetical protein ALECFALPRED_006103 [Alectoria fallacina]|uniref:Uncharacterized protein n=1 Tax=Alectoria fallacina TaxID=1903189 RepID=A0A8H3ET17_9LECA|nr:MAG: hypothetical protein ALECFALPRED_006103 [Alectoria fallacina]